MERKVINIKETGKIKEANKGLRKVLIVKFKY